MAEITNINPLRVWVQHVLPLVYDDSLSYYELLCKMTDKINQLINNNNVLPEYIEQVVASQVKAFFETEEGINLLSPFVSEINVTDPPFGLAPVSNTGNTDEHDRIMAIYNVCATKHIKMYFPTGIYLTSQLDLTGSVNIRGDGYAKTKIYGVENNSGYVFNFNSCDGNITDLEINANVISQVQKPSCVFVSINSDVYFGRVKFNNGYYCMVNEGRASVNSGCFDNAFFASYKDSPTSDIRCINLTIFNDKPFAVTSRNARFVGIEIVGAAKINAEGENGLYIINAGAEDSVITSITSNQIWILNKYAKVSGKTVNINFDNVNITNSGDTTINSGDVTLDANNVTSTIASDKLSDVKGKRTVKSGTKEETVNGAEVRTITGKETETFGSRETTINGSETETIGSRETTINGTNSEVTHGNKSETIDNAKTVNANSETHTVTGILELNAGQYKMLDVVRRTPTGTKNYVDEAPFIDNDGNNKALLVKGATDINTAINQLVTNFGNLEQDVSGLNEIPAKVDALGTKVDGLVTKVEGLETNVTTLSNDQRTLKFDVDELGQEVEQIKKGELTTIEVTLATEKLSVGSLENVAHVDITDPGYYLIQLNVYTDSETNDRVYADVTDNATTTIAADKTHYQMPVFYSKQYADTSQTVYNSGSSCVAKLTAGRWYLHGYGYSSVSPTVQQKIIFPAGRCMTLTKLSAAT